MRREVKRSKRGNVMKGREIDKDKGEMMDGKN